MSLIRDVLILSMCAVPFQVMADDTFMSTGPEMALAIMAVQDRGYSLADPHNTLESTKPEAKETLKAYHQIDLYVSPNVPVDTDFFVDLAMNLAIRIDTADVVDTYTCTVFRYPDLMEFRRKWLKNTGNKPVSLARIRNELYCPRPLKVVPAPKHSYWAR